MHHARIHHLVLTVALLVVLILLAGCAPILSSGPSLELTGSGKLIKQDFSFDKAERLAVASNFKVVLSPADKVAVTVEADDNVMEYVYIHVSSGELRLELKPGRGYSMNKVTLKATVTMPVPHTVNVRDNATLALSNGLRASELTVQLNGNAIITGDDISVAKLSLTSQGNGMARLSGAAAIFNMDGRNNTQAVCPKLQVHTADVQLRDNSMLALTVTDNLGYDVSGNAGLTYSGSPKLGTQKRSDNAYVRQS